MSDGQRESEATMRFRVYYDNKFRNFFDRCLTFYKLAVAYLAPVSLMFSVIPYLPKFSIFLHISHTIDVIVTNIPETK